MGVILTTKNDVSQRRTDPEHPIENFKGVIAQLVVDTNNDYRIVVMDGKTLGGKARVALENARNNFTHRPTVPYAKDIASVRPNAVINKSNVQDLINEAMQDAVDVKVIKTEDEMAPSVMVDTFYFIENE